MNCIAKSGRIFRWFVLIVSVAGVCAQAAAARPRDNQQNEQVAAPLQSDHNRSLERAQKLMALTPPDELVRQAINNELHEKREGHYLYRDWRKTPEGSTTKEVLETPEGDVARLIAINDHPLTPDQQSAEQDRLQKLVQHPEEQQKKKKEQEQDADRVTRMFKQLPDAFNYTYDGVEPGPSGALVHLKFEPNPKYSPPSRETSVFKSMSGQMWIATPRIRLAKIQATLFRDVNFGWGILGHLDKGGHFFVSQTEINPSYWEATDMNIQFTGKMLLFKTIDMRQVEKLSDFRRVPDNLSLAQAIDILNKTGNQVAESVPEK